MFCIRIGNIDELGKVKDFYDSLIEEMQEAEYKPGWKKDIYPTMEMLREALEKGELYIGEEEGKTASCMILNRTCNERYQEISWPTKAEPDQVLAVHTFGVHPRFSRPGTGKKDDGRGSKDGSRQRYEGYPSGCSGGEPAGREAISESRISI